MHFFLLKAKETIFNINTIPFLKCKQMLNYKLNLLSSKNISAKYQISHIKTKIKTKST